MKNITLSADDEAIEAARENTRRNKTTLFSEDLQYENNRIIDDYQSISTGIVW